MMPSYFFAHGAPSLVIEDHEYTQFLKEFAQTLPKPPKAIVIFSAHWESQVQQVSYAKQYETIYDFGGFPDVLYQMTYPALGDASVSEQVTSLLEQHHIASQADDYRGLDHGAWAVLKLIYPQVDIPVIALSVNRHLSNQQQYEIGQALGELREQDILIIGSGGIVHNLRQLNWSAADHQVDSWAADFDQWIQERVEQWNIEELYQYDKLAPFVSQAVPTSEHFIPLLLAMGSGDQNRQAKLLHRSYQYGNLSLAAWQFN
ncbi:4,5-DOPA dioxygenase extradiol [Paenibacillus sp. SORGH_AS306]|uniref:dioxygenase family protein n=1 Tax=unclassified Paenibacillus TaxID=185978 RepID=UPI00277F3D52|nr:MULTISPECIES: class III extradiol ring-cleavage dioxygenase [unclassified Paenibacillus]MDQ1235170.1 4,5-DOPA dioxygenase extradiol [Paenibacillus sp. SORGH_AS_0306]MDR6112217.1 4,5-DOPA dioxygenase extradiol [Paenibacillus sp. SORGH_AS_0338]